MSSRSTTRRTSEGRLYCEACSSVVKCLNRLEEKRERKRERRSRRRRGQQRSSRQLTIARNSSYRFGQSAVGLITVGRCDVAEVTATRRVADGALEIRRDSTPRASLSRSSPTFRSHQSSRQPPQRCSRPPILVARVLTLQPPLQYPLRPPEMVRTALLRTIACAR
jgi:hypothetical protein